MLDARRDILDHPAVCSSLFFPRRISEPVLSFFAAGEVVRIPAGEDLLGAMLHAPLKDAPLILFFHGNGEVMTDYFFRYHARVQAAGANLLVVDYRGYGLSTGRPSLTNLLEDARASFNYVTGPMSVDPRKVVIMGRSLGSLAAIEAASGPGRAAGGLVIESGIARPGSWVTRLMPLLAVAGVDCLALERALAAEFDHERKIREFGGPVMIMHAPFDEIVPVENAYEMASWVDPMRMRLKVFPAGTHNDIFFVNETEYFRALGEFVSLLGA